MRLTFTKMHGLGNDFVVVDATRGPIELSVHQRQMIADRHLGIGCDQILQVESPREAGTDFYYRIFNADGGEVEQCGNGARCFARYVHHKGLTSKNEIRVGTRGGIITPRLEADGQVTVDMGVPQLEPARIPFVADKQALTYNIDIDRKNITISVLSMGNPHAVQLVSSVERAPVNTEGPLIERHPRFPERANAGYMERVSSAHIRLRVYERGAGETLSCGTGACAAVVVGRMRGLLDERVRVTTRGGDLYIRWRGEGHTVEMTGPAATVFEGEIDL
jgi:diaminopimelate epimerase